MHRQTLIAPPSDEPVSFPFSLLVDNGVASRLSVGVKALLMVAGLSYDVIVEQIVSSSGSAFSCLSLSQSPETQSEGKARERAFF